MSVSNNNQSNKNFSTNELNTSTGDSQQHINEKREKDRQDYEDHLRRGAYLQQQQQQQQQNRGF